MIKSTGSGSEMKQQNDGEGVKQEGVGRRDICWDWDGKRFTGPDVYFRLGSPQPRLRTPQLDTELVFFRR